MKWTKQANPEEKNKEIQQNKQSPTISNQTNRHNIHCSIKSQLSKHNVKPKSGKENMLIYIYKKKKRKNLQILRRYLLLPKREVRRRYTEHRWISLSHGVYNSFFSVTYLFLSLLSQNIKKISKRLLLYCFSQLPLSHIEAHVSFLATLSLS